jgi:hypothetical protein
LTPHVLILAAALKVAIPAFTLEHAPPPLSMRLSDAYAKGMSAAQCATGMPAEQLSQELTNEFNKCGDQTACIADIGRLAGADLVVTGHVRRLDTSYFITLNVIDVKISRTRARQEVRYEGKATGIEADVKNHVTELCKAVNPEWTPVTAESLLADLAFDDGSSLAPAPAAKPADEEFILPPFEDEPAKPAAPPTVDKTPPVAPAAPAQPPEVVTPPVVVAKLEPAPLPVATIEAPKPIEPPAVVAVVEPPKPLAPPMVEAMKPVETPIMPPVVVEAARPVETPIMPPVVVEAARPVETPTVPPVAEAAKPVETAAVVEAAKPVETPVVDATKLPVVADSAKPPPIEKKIELKPRPSRPIPWTLIAAGGTVAFAAVGIGLGAKSSSVWSGDQTVAQSGIVRHSITHAQADTANSFAVGANVMIGLAAAAGIGTGLLIYFNGGLGLNGKF